MALQSERLLRARMFRARLRLVHAQTFSEIGGERQRREADPSAARVRQEAATTQLAEAVATASFSRQVGRRAQVASLSPAEAPSGSSSQARHGRFSPGSRRRKLIVTSSATATQRPPPRLPGSPPHNARMQAQRWLSKEEIKDSLERSSGRSSSPSPIRAPHTCATPRFGAATTPHSTTPEGGGADGSRDAAAHQQHPKRTDNFPMGFQCLHRV